MSVTTYKIVIHAEANISTVQGFRKKSKTIATFTGSIIQVLFIKLFGKVRKLNSSKIYYLWNLVEKKLIKLGNLFMHSKYYCPKKIFFHVSVLFVLEN